MDSVRIVMMCVVAVALYGVIHDQITARVRVLHDRSSADLRHERPEVVDHRLGHRAWWNGDSCRVRRRPVDDQGDFDGSNALMIALLSAAP